MGDGRWEMGDGRWERGEGRGWERRFARAGGLGVGVDAGERVNTGTRTGTDGPLTFGFVPSLQELRRTG
ncbi:MAG: hypothetical protein RI897_803 [Verrucomicrobiota bacterium]